MYMFYCLFEKMFELSRQINMVIKGDNLLFVVFLKKKWKLLLLAVFISAQFLAAIWMFLWCCCEQNTSMSLRHTQCFALNWYFSCLNMNRIFLCSFRTLVITYSSLTYIILSKSSFSVLLFVCILLHQIEQWNPQKYLWIKDSVIVCLDW